MRNDRDETAGPALPRLATGVPGLDVVLGGGLPAGRAVTPAGPFGARGWTADLLSRAASTLTSANRTEPPPLPPRPPEQGGGT